MFKSSLFTSHLLVRKRINLQSIVYISKFQVDKLFEKLEEKKLERQKMSNQTNRDKLTPATIDFTILGNGGIGTPKSIYIVTSEDNYLIGCSENSARLATALG